MALVEIGGDRLRLVAAPAVGGSIASLEVRTPAGWLPIFRPTSAEAIAAGRSSPFASFALVPWSNRVRDARFRFAGREIRLRPNTADGHAIHGDVRDRPWEIAARSPGALRLAFDSRSFADLNFPFPFRASLELSVDGPVAAMAVAVTNSGPTPMPAGIGFHPYFRRALVDPAEDVVVRMGAGAVYPDLLPRGPAVPVEPPFDFRSGRAIGGQSLDHCFAAWNGRAELRWPATGLRLAIEATAALRHVILYAPPGEPFLALEPVSHANDGFNLEAAGVAGTGVRVLAPGESLAGTVRLIVA